MASAETAVEASHTPGPWVVTGEIDRFHGGEWIRPLNAEGYQKSELVAVVCDFNRYDRDTERQANARLIAAAPSMAAELLWIREHLHPQALGRAATGAELIAITRATKVLREAGV